MTVKVEEYGQMLALDGYNVFSIWTAELICDTSLSIKRALSFLSVHLMNFSQE